MTGVSRGNKKAKRRQIAALLDIDDLLDEELTFVIDNKDEESDGDVCERCFKTRADHAENDFCKFKGV